MHEANVHDIKPPVGIKGFILELGNSRSKLTARLKKKEKKVIIINEGELFFLQPQQFARRA